ncbi:sugar transferase [Latilactobacillus curvatus]|nr:sugar transferase [Latilactobacillus curvatus]MDG2986632.1 sugar transferase [Latilactobacillus curvatus]
MEIQKQNLVKATEVENTRQVMLFNQAEIDQRYGYRALKRLFDIVASLVGLVLLSPLFLVVAILIKIDDPVGSVFYSQTRLGLKQHKFKMYKFRSMCTNADEKLKNLLAYNEVEGAMFKMKKDPRITRVGKFIREYSIDELPQLWNVLVGDMTLVGPRPPLEREIKEYTDYDWQRLMVKPGCTGLWQVSGRNSIGFHEMVDLDLKYIRKSSLVYDLGILFRTVKIMIMPNDAY